MDEVATLDVAISYPSLKDERAVARPGSADLARVAEVLEHLSHGMEQRLHLVAAPVGRVNNGTAEDDVVREEGSKAVQVAGLNCGAEFLHFASTFAR